MTTHRVRRAVQLIFLLFFLWLFLQTESKGADQLGYPVKLFLDGDPLIFITTVLATRSFYGGINVVVLVAAVVVATVLLGRVFCGWVCPMGTLHELVGNSTKGNTKRSQGRDEERGDQPLYRLKYLLLVFIMVSAALGMQTAAFFDPISLLIRSLALAVYPAFAYGLTALVELLYYPELSPLTAVADMLLRGLKASILPFQQPFFHQALPIGLLFFLILSLNMVRKRFWCRFICPLGALLGLLGRYALLNRMVAEGCDGCRRCEKYCQGGAGPASRGEWKKAECLVCLECLDPCPRAAARFKMGGKAGVVTGLDLGRRRVIGAALAGAVLVPLVRVSPAAQATVANPVLIRPPGAVGEKEFLARCIRCGECMKVCITGGLQPALVEAGLEGLWSPVLVPRVGYCEYRCTLCGQVCPTGAIRKLTMEEKGKVRIGLAMIDRSLCLPFAYGVPCLVCEEVCPTSPKAVVMTTTTERGRILKQPRVDLDKCVGCGICEAKCPIVGRPAITVISLGESRRPENRELWRP